MSTTALGHAFDVLEAIKQSPGGLTNSEISRRLEIPKSSCSYVLDRLESNGYLVRTKDGRRYRIGPTILALAYGALRDMGFRSATEPALYKLASETGLSASIAILERNRALVVDRVESPAVWKSGATDLPISKFAPHHVRRREQREIGRELPPHSNSVGKVLLAYLPEEQLHALLARLELPRSTKNSISTKEKLLEELKLVRSQGYAIDREEQYAGVFALACPIVNDRGDVQAAVTVDGNSTDADWNDPWKLIPIVQEGAREIAKSPLFNNSYLTDVALSS